MSGRHESFERTTGEGHSADIWARSGSKILLGRPVELFSVEPVPIMPVAAGLLRGRDDRASVSFPLNKLIWNMVTGGGDRVGGGKGGRSMSLPAWQEGGDGRGGKVGKGRECMVESQFCVSSLCFKTDRVTVKERVELVDRQRSIAWTAIHQVGLASIISADPVSRIHWPITQRQELANFSSLLHQLSSMGYTSDIHEVSHLPFLL